MGSLSLSLEEEEESSSFSFEKKNGEPLCLSRRSRRRNPSFKETEEEEKTLSVLRKRRSHSLEDFSRRRNRSLCLFLEKQEQKPLSRVFLKVDFEIEVTWRSCHMSAYHVELEQ